MEILISLDVCRGWTFDRRARAESTETLKAWESAVVGKGVDLRLITDRSKMESVLEYVTEGNRAQNAGPRLRG